MAQRTPPNQICLSDDGRKCFMAYGVIKDVFFYCRPLSLSSFNLLRLSLQFGLSRSMNFATLVFQVVMKSLTKVFF